MTAPLPDVACQELVELVTSYLEGTLPEADRTRFELHLCTCDPCRAYLQQVRTLLRAAGRVTEADLPAEAKQGLLAAFRGWKGGPGGAP